MNVSAKQLRSMDYVTIKELNALVSSLFPRNSRGGITSTRQFYDTFDRRLAQKEYLLEEDLIDQKLSLRLRSVPSQDDIFEVHNSRHLRTCQDVKSNQLKDKLMSIVGQRALLPGAMYYIKSTIYDVSNRDGKIIIRISVEGHFNKNNFRPENCIAVYLVLLPLRGYEKQLIKTEKLLKTEFAFTDVLDSNITSKLIKKSRGQDYLPPNFCMALEPNMPSKAALSSILLYHLDVMENNENGILKDIDIEFLHDFRIANRRSRSVIGQVRDVFPESRIKRFSNYMSLLSDVTSLHRDLDVFLWDFDDYVKLVSSSGGEELESLNQLLLSKREIAHKKLLSTFKTKRFKNFKDDWRKFLLQSKTSQLKTANGNLPVQKVANETVWRVFKQGKRLTKKYDYESIHNLRKTGKKLRYVINAFETLYPDDEISQLLKSLKRLQNNLGEITDMHIQREMMKSWEMDLVSDTKVSPETIVAIKELENFCSKREKMAEKYFNQNFQNFSSDKNKKMIEELFH